MSSFSPSGTANASIVTTVRHSSRTGPFGARRTSRVRTRALARAMATASAAVRSIEASVRSGVAENPQEPSATTRTPTPRLSVSPIEPTFPFLTTRLCVRIRMARASAYEARCTRAVSMARAASSFTGVLLTGERKV